MRRLKSQKGHSGLSGLRYPRGVTMETDPDGVTLFSSRTGLYWRGNVVAAVVCDLIFEGLLLEQIVDAVSDRFGAERAEVQYDVELLVSEFLRERLVVEVME